MMRMEMKSILSIPMDNEVWKDYDDNGNLIHSKDSTGYEEWNEYDENGNKIHTKDSEVMKNGITKH